MHYAPMPQQQRSLALPLMAAAILGAGIATATFALVNIEDEPIVSLPTPAVESTAVPFDAVAGQRNDGGPAEGTALQIVRPETAESVNPQTAGSATASKDEAGVRYDGGPEEGSRVVVTEQPDTTISGGPTPYSGARP